MDKLKPIGRHDPRHTFIMIVESWLADKADSTRETYQRDLEHIQKWAQASSSLEFLTHLFGLSTPDIYLTVEQYRSHLIMQGTAPSTINRRLSVLRSLSRKAVAAGLAKHPILNDGVPSSVDPDRTKMVENEDWQTLVGYLRGRLKPAGTQAERFARRDLAVLRLLRDVGLRRKEVVTAESINFDKKTIRIYPKGPKGRVLEHPVDGLAWECLIDWLELPPPDNETMFGFQTLGALNKHLGRLAQRAGIPHVSPHMFRRSGITGAVDHFGGTSREAVAFARHRDPKMTARYDKSNKDKRIREAQQHLGKDK